MEKKALIIDDTKNIRMMLTKCLELEGYQVDTSDNGKDGLEQAAKDVYQLIFLDIKLPEISGTEVLRQLRGRQIHTPVIIITAYPTVKNAVDCTQLGAITYLQKPFTMDRIHHVLSQLQLDDASSPSAQSWEQAETLLEHGKAEEALVLLKNALSSSPAESRIYRLLGRAYEQLGQNALAERFYKAADLFS